MAEVYGVKPKKFTKEWWPYFWMYYKWHTIIIAVVALLVLTTVSQCVNSEKYDLTITYLGDRYFSDEEEEAFTSGLEPFIVDSDGNGENNIYFSELTIDERTGNEQMNMTMIMKHDMQMTDADTYVYIYNEEQMYKQLKRDYLSDTYIAVDKWLDSEIDSNRYVFGDDGTAYAVSLEGSKFLESIGIDSSDMYVMVRNDNADETTNEKAKEGGINAANELVKI